MRTERISGYGKERTIDYTWTNPIRNGDMK